jgi:putative ABC transport system ATP-binding protein
MHSSADPTAVLQLSGVTKEYATATHRLRVLDTIDLRIARGDCVAITGPSGSGKTTLLGLCAGLDLPTSGELWLAGAALHTLDEEARAAVRLRKVGFVFQNFQLLPTLTALENVCVPLELRGERGAAQRARAWLARVGLADRADHYPVQMSGGEQQRVAIARACASEPEVLFADEPTGNLDGDTSAQIEELLFGLHRATGNSMVVVTHDTELAARTDRIIRVRGGRLVEAEGTSV